MYIEWTRVREFGTLGDIEVDFSEGLNVISGPNEAGKSTLMQAIWFALTRRCTSNAEEIRNIVPNAGGTPSVEVHIGVDGTRYEMEKVFDGQSGRTSLRVQHEYGSIDQHAGEEADEVIREALGFGEASGRTGVPEHFGFWPAVWVGQDDRQLDPGKHLTEEGDPDSISSVLGQIGGDVMAGSGAEIVERAREEYERFYTDSGNYTSRSGAPLHEAKKERDRAEERFEELKDRRKAYEEDLDALGRLQGEIERLDEQLPDLEKEAEEAQEAFERVETLQGDLETAESRLETAESEVERLQSKLNRREDLREEIEELESKLEEKQNEVADKEEIIESHREERAELKKAAEEAEDRKESIERKERRLRAHLDVLRAEERLQGIEERSDELSGLKDRRAELAGEISGISVEEEDVAELEELKEERDRMQTRLETAAAQLRFRAEEDTDVRISDETLRLGEGDEEARRIEEPTTIGVGASLEIDIEPGGEDLASIRESARSAQEEYEEALEELGAESVADARSQSQRKQRLESDLQSVKEQIESLMPDEESDLEEARARLERKIEDAKEKRESYADSENEDALPSEEEEVQDRLTEAEEDLDAAGEELEAARETLQKHDSKTQSLREEMQQLQARAETLEESLETARQNLEDHVEEHGPDEALEENLEEAENDLEDREGRVEEIESELQDLSPEDLKERKSRTEDALEAAEDERTELKSDLDKVQGRLESEDLRGLHGRLEQARQASKKLRPRWTAWGGRPRPRSYSTKRLLRSDRRLAKSISLPSVRRWRTSWAASSARRRPPWSLMRSSALAS
jgi:DNA repair exonuclease SbcCD ATPase subunit